MLFFSVQISKTYTHYGAIILFMYFGLRMLYDVAFGGEAVSLLSLLQIAQLLSSSGPRPMMRLTLKDQPTDFSGDTLRS